MLYLPADELLLRCAKAGRAQKAGLTRRRSCARTLTEVTKRARTSADTVFRVGFFFGSGAYAYNSRRYPWRDRHGRPAVRRPFDKSPVVPGQLARGERAVRGQARIETLQRGGSQRPLPTKSLRSRLTPPRPVAHRKLVFSGLDSSVAGEIEAAFAQAGHIIVSNSRNHRMEQTVPLLIPEVNADHLALLDAQRAAQGWKGRIVTNPNCAVVVLAMALAPLRQFGLKATTVTTMQAISGAGYPGVASWDILANIIPYIGGGEEEKVETETKKILGCLRNGARRSTRARRSARTTTRVPVHNGHTGSISVRPGAEAAGRSDRSTRGDPSEARPQELKLPSAPPAADRLPDRSESSAALARCRSRRRHDGERRPPAALSGARLQVRRPRPQHDSRRRRRGDSERGADAQEGLL